MKSIDRFGSEDFNIDTEIKFANHWNAFMESRMCFYHNNKDKLLKDFEITFYCLKVAKKLHHPFHEISKIEKQYLYLQQ